MRTNNNYEANEAIECVFGLPSIGLPAEALFHPKLSHMEKILFGFIRNLSQSSRGCWATNKYLGSLLGVGAQSISNGVAKLKQLGFVRIDYRKHLDGTESRAIYIDASYLIKYQKQVQQIHDDIYGPIKKLIGGYNNNNRGVNENLYDPYIKIYKKDDIEEDIKKDISLRDKSLRDNECENQSLDSISNDFDSNNNQTDIPSKTKNDEIISRFIPYSKQLANIIQTSKNITITSNQIKTWARSIHQLHKLGISLSRIKTALEWYANHIGGEYIPVIESGSSFKEKFTKLESAMERESKHNIKTPPKINEDSVDETKRKILVSNKGLPEHVHHLPFNHPERLKYMDLSNLEKFDPDKTNWTDDPNA